MKAVIMAGGKGTRLRPLSCDLPKPMVPILNKPILEHILLLLKKEGITQVAITMCYLPEQIMNYFGDGSDWGMQITYYIEDSPLGTAGSVRNAAEFLNETFLVISGDALTDFKLQQALDYHRQKQALATLLLTRVDVPLEYGVVITDSDGRINQFLEKPSWSEVFSDTVNTGIYILEPEIFDYFEAGTAVDFSKDLFPYLLKKGEPLYGYIAQGYWSDIGSLEQYRLSHFDLLDGKVQAVKKGRQWSEDIWVGLGTTIEPGARLTGPCYIGRNCYIAKDALVGEYTIIGDNCTVREGAALKRAILWENVYVGRGAEVKGAVLADRVALKDDSAVLEGAVVGKGSNIGRRVIVKPNVRIWPEKQFDAELVLNTSVVWGNRSPQRLFGSRGVIGTTNIEITPEYMAKLGAALGCTLGPKSRAAIATDGEKVARIMKKAVISGLLSAGTNVVDLGLATAPVLSFTITNLRLRGGVLIRSEGQDRLSIEFYDAGGLLLAQSALRSLENLFFREDFSRSQPEQMGELSYLPTAGEPYLTAIFRHTDYQRLVMTGQKIHLGWSGAAARWAAKLLQRTLPDLVSADCCENVQKLSAQVLSNQADLGLWLGSGGELFSFADEKGRVLPEEMQWNLLVYGLLLAGRKQVAVPINAPGSVETIAAKFSAEVLRTKADPRSLLERESPPLGLPAYDGLAATLLVLEILGQTGLPLSQVLKEFPVPVRKSTDIPCSWEVKGKVMRSLLETAQGEKVQLLDGVKVFHSKGWALVWPDAEEPLFHILSEAETMEEADRLSQLYAAKISGFSS